jgi:hypothetical protein
MMLAAFSILQHRRSLCRFSPHHTNAPGINPPESAKSRRDLQVFKNQGLTTSNPSTKSPMMTCLALSIQKPDIRTNGKRHHLQQYLFRFNALLKVRIDKY